ncbi:MAG TPA: hypothetical protein DDX51_05590 [Clostridiales bacterium]|nr:hypothetical protein [Clostridiales bacterium]
MNRKIAGCAAAALLCTSLLCGAPASAVSLKQPSVQSESLLQAADAALLLPQSLDGQTASQTITRVQMCGLAVRLYASLSDLEYDSMMQQSAAPRMACPFADTQDADVQQAWLLGLTEEKGTAFAPNDAATRQQLIAMLYRAMQQSGSEVSVSPNEIAETLYSFADGGAIAPEGRAGMTYFVREGLTSGTGSRQLGGVYPISAEQAVILTYRAAAAVHTGRGASGAQQPGAIATHSGTGAVTWTGCGADYYRVSFYRTADFSAAPVLTEQMSAAGSGAQELALPQKIAEQTGTWYWSVDGFDCAGKLLASSGQPTELTVEKQTAQINEGGLYIPSEPLVEEPDVIAQTVPEGLTNSRESYSEKVARIFGEGAGYHKYANSAEAASHQVTIAVPVWDIASDGSKYTRVMRFEIHEALAATVQQIFAEIYVGGEQFPICSLGGYCWRGDGSSSEHCLGTAIDINPSQNYMCTNSGRALTGSHWTPGSDPYSIPADGDVVRIFAKYGFGWGGTWSSKKDYMHFSYFGT